MPRPIEPILDDVFYTFYRAPKQAAKCDCGATGDELHEADCASYSGTNCSECGAQSNELHDADCPKAGRQSSKRSGVGNDEMDDSVPRSKNWDPFASTDTFMGEERESDDDDDDESEKKNSMLHTAPGGGVHGPYRIEESGGGFDVVNSQGESKGHHETREQAREQQKALYVNIPEAQEQAKKSNLDNFGDKKAKPFGSEDDDDVDDDVDEFLQGGDKERGGGTGGFNDPSEKKSSRRRLADTREQMELGLRGDCEACVGTGELYAGEPCPACNGTGNKSGQPDQQPSRGTTWTPPNYQSSRRKKLSDDSLAPSGPSFTAPDSMRGGWKCSDCSADDLGVHDLNGHAEAHRQTSHRESAIGLFL